MSHFTHMSEVVQGRCAILAGFETVTLQAFEQGAVGLLAGGANVYPGLLNALVQACRNNDRETAAVLQDLVSTSWGKICEIGIWGPAIKKVINDVIGIEMNPYDRGTDPADQLYDDVDADSALVFFQSIFE